MGATTIWERWNSLDAEGRFGPVEMNSFNHYANGAVGDWMFHRLGGLQMLEPGYRRSRIAPLVSHPALRHAKASLQTPYGLLAVDWRSTAGGLHLDADVPVGTDAEIVLPAPASARVREGRHPAWRAPGIRQVRWKNGELRLRVGSGHYVLHLTSRLSAGRRPPARDAGVQSARPASGSSGPGRAVMPP
jgi:alpha-L-rhamnosidase